MKFKHWHLFAGLPLLVLLGFAVLKLKVEWDKNTELAKLRSMGVPLTQSEYLESAGAFDPESTALYQEAHGLLKSTAQHGYTSWVRSGRVLPLHRDFLAANTKASAVIREASLLGKPEGYPGTTNREYELLAAVPQIAAYVASFDGQHDQALESLQTLDRVIAHFYLRPGAARNNAREWNFPPVEQVLLRNAKDDKTALTHLASYFASRPSLPPPASNLKLNFLEMNEIMDKRIEKAGFPEAKNYAGPMRVAIRSSLRQAALKVFSNIDFAAFDFRSHQEIILAVHSSTTKQETRDFCEGMIETLKSAYRTETIRRLQQVAAGVMLKRLETGSLPKAFQCPEGNPDPHNGKPFFYKRLSDGFVVYSIGPNGVYDNGLGDDIPISIQW